MQTWKKITIAVGVIIILVGGYLYFRGAETNNKPEEVGGENPVFPFESGADDDFFGGEATRNRQESRAETETTSVSQSQLWQISEDPVAGGGWVNRDGKEEVWFISRANGHIFSTTPENRELTRITNTTIPQVYEALIASDGQFVIYRYLSEEGEIKSYLANLENSEGEVRYRVNGSFLPDNIRSINISPDGSSVFYLHPAGGGVVGVIYQPPTEEVEVIFESAAKEWRSEWTSPELITIFTAADLNTTGFAYQINTSGSLDKVAEGQGLVAKVSPNNSYVLSSQYESGEYRIRVHKKGENTTLLSSPTLGDKCDWAAGVSAFFCGVPESLPNNPLKNWYQGRFSFTDNLVLFNPTNRSQSTLFDEEQLKKGPFDIINIQTNVGFNTAIFTNKQTGQLWGFEL